MLSRLAYTTSDRDRRSFIQRADVHLDLWSGYPIAMPFSTAGIQPAPQLKSVPAAATETMPGNACGSLAEGRRGEFNGRHRAPPCEPQTGTSVVAGQPILKLVTTPQMATTQLPDSFEPQQKQVYRVTAWVKPEAGGKRRARTSDGAIGQPFITPSQYHLGTCGDRHRRRRKAARHRPGP